MKLVLNLKKKQTDKIVFSLMKIYGIIPMFHVQLLNNNLNQCKLDLPSLQRQVTL